MEKSKIGVLIWTDNAFISGRADRKNKYYDSFSYSGLNKILNELNYDYDFISVIDINNYDFILISLISYLDILNLVSTIPTKRKCKIILGGPACNNIRGFIDYIDIAVFGRCDSGDINKIIDGKILSNVWYKSNDPKFEFEYIVGITKELSINEKSVGCKRKCAFCFYSHWNKYYTKKQHKGYSSGYLEYEDIFLSLDWEKCKRGGVSAFDGLSEKSRYLVKKPLYKENIIEKLFESNNISFKDKKLRLKLYCIAGYPWEDEKIIENFDLIKIIEHISKKIRNRIVIKLHISHFIPFQKTPMSCKI